MARLARVIVLNVQEHGGNGGCPPRMPRTKGGGIFVQASLLEGHSFFKVNQFPVRNVCTNAVRDFVLERRYTNIDFFEVGELF